MSDMPGMSATPAQPAMTGMDHGTMTMPATPAQSGTMEGMDHGSMPGMQSQTGTSSMPGMDMPGGQAGHDMSAMSGMAQTGTNLPAGTALAPRPPMDHYAEKLFPAPEMAAASRVMPPLPSVER